jgi:hypothetical protein
MSSCIIHLVLGVSCSGKSAYIEFKRDSGEWENIPILMAHEVDAGSSHDILKKECIVHYNLFKPYGHDAKNIKNSILEDKALSDLLKCRDRIKAYLLVSHPAVISKRVRQRTGLEVSLRKTTGRYPQQKVLQLLCSLDLKEFHIKWISLLKEFQLDLKILNSETYEYATIASHDDFQSIFLPRKIFPTQTRKFAKLLNLMILNIRKLTSYSKLHSS